MAAQPFHKILSLPLCNFVFFLLAAVASGAADVSRSSQRHVALMRSAVTDLPSTAPSVNRSKAEQVRPSVLHHHRRSLNKFISLDGRQHHCGAIPVPHYPKVNREHEVVCGNGMDACKPTDALDIVDEEVSELTEKFLRSVVAGNQSHMRQLKERSRALKRNLEKDRALQAIYANDELVNLSPISALFSAGRGFPPVKERQAWEDLIKANAMRDSCDQMNLCSCMSIACDVGRVSAVFLARFGGLATLAPLRRFQHLRTAAVVALGVSWRSVELGVGSLKQLQTLVVYLKSMTRDGLSDLALAAPNLRFLDLGLHRRSEPQDEDALPASELEPLCELRQLRYLKIFGPFTGLPSCFGNLTNLLHLDIRGLWLNRPLPPSFSALTKLRTFVAFGQREHRCAVEGCIASVANRVQYEKPLVFWCPTGGWNVPLESIMFPEWTNIEKFWVDQNFLVGSIPSWLPDKWRKLRSLDLYSNQLTGSVPDRLVAMPSLFQLQLHDNAFNGTVPHVRHLSPRLKFLDVSLNPALHGCWPHPEAVAKGENNINTVLLGAHTEILRSSSCLVEVSEDVEADRNATLVAEES